MFLDFFLDFYIILCINFVSDKVMTSQPTLTQWNGLT